MKERTNSPYHLILFILVLINSVIIRDGFLLDNKIYLALFGTIPLTLYVGYGIWKRRRKPIIYQI